MFNSVFLKKEKREKKKKESGNLIHYEGGCSLCFLKKGKEAGETEGTPQSIHGVWDGGTKLEREGAEIWGTFPLSFFFFFFFLGGWGGRYIHLNREEKER